MTSGALDPTPVATHDFSDFGSANSLDASNGVLAVAVGAAIKQAPGRVYLYTTVCPLAWQPVPRPAPRH